MITFTIPGGVGGKGRARFSKNSPRPYTPAKTVRQELTVSQIAAQAMEGRGPFDGAVALTIKACYVPPASWSAKKKAAALVAMKITKPDLDNIIKLVSDACDGIVWRGDQQVAAIMAWKYYGVENAVYVEVKEL